MQKNAPDQKIQSAEKSQANINIESSFKAQRQRLLEALRHGPVTTIEAREQLNVMHPAGRVNELREQGYKIITEREWLVDSVGRKHKAGKYYLIKGEI